MEVRELIKNMGPDKLRAAIAEYETEEKAKALANELELALDEARDEVVEAAMNYIDILGRKAGMEELMEEADWVEAHKAMAKDLKAKEGSFIRLFKTFAPMLLEEEKNTARPNIHEERGLFGRTARIANSDDILRDFLKKMDIKE